MYKAKLIGGPANGQTIDEIWGKGDILYHTPDVVNAAEVAEYILQGEYPVNVLNYHFIRYVPKSDALAKGKGQVRAA